MGLKDFISRKKTENSLSNAYYCVIETWRDTEYMFNKKLITHYDVKGVLNGVCKDAKKELAKAKEQDAQTYEQYVQKFDMLFARVEDYISNLSTDLHI